MAHRRDSIEPATHREGMMVLTREDGDAAPAKRRRLAIELRLLRDVNGITGRELARRIGISQSKISRIEAGVALPSVEEIKAWTQAVGATADTEDLLAKLTDAARTEVDAWHDARGGLLRVTGTAEAPRFCLARSFEPTMIPGFLQTPAYAQITLTMLKQIMPQTDVPSSARDRINRQSELYEEDKEFEFLIGEGALRWRPGSPRLLIAQLAQIATMSTKDNVRIGIVPLLSTEATVALYHPFSIYGTAENSTYLVQVETTHDELILTATDTTATYERYWDSLRATARFGDDARQILAEVTAALQAIQN
jgi:transcriptional regulator with XRE-family HTH domain